jgi:adenylate kinase family enzyme
VAALGYKHLSSGEQLRDHIRRATPLGRQASGFIENGQFVPDELATQMVQTLRAAIEPALVHVHDQRTRT